MMLRMAQALAALGFIAMWGAFEAVSRGVTCVGYCYGQDVFDVHTTEDLK